LFVLLAACIGPISLAQADTQGQAIVNAAQEMENAGYPYCFDGGNINGPTGGTTDSSSDGSYSNCASIGKIGFDCTGLTLYAVYQGTGNAGLSHDGYQAKSGGGQVISSQSDLQAGDIVYFDYNASNGLNYIDHAGIYTGGGMVLSAVSEKWGIRTESISWYEAGGLHFVGGVRYWSGGGPNPGSFVSYQGNVYTIAGGAPIYVSTWDAFGGPQPTQPLTDPQWAALRSIPADGTGLCGQQAGGGGGAFVVAGGSPVWISSFNNVSPNPCVPVDEYSIDHAGGGGVLNHLRFYPADGTFLSGQPRENLYRVAGGAPVAVTDCGALSGCASPVAVDQVAITEAGGSATPSLAHLASAPANGTVLEGLPSQSYWSFKSGYRSPTAATATAVAVNDVSLAVYPEVPPTTVSPPRISGTAQQGQTLTEAHGSWSSDPSGFSYQWQDCGSSGNDCAAIASAASQTYTLAASDVGHAIRVEEWATNASGTGGPATSSATAAVVSAAGSGSSGGSGGGGSGGGSGGGGPAGGNGTDGGGSGSGLGTGSGSGTSTGVASGALAGVGTPTLGRVKVAGTAVSVSVGCNGSTRTTCAVTVALTVIETLKGGRVIAVTASKSKRKTMVLGTAIVTLTGGQSKTVHIALSAAGKRMLAKYQSLKVKLTIREAGSVQTTVVSATITFETKLKKQTH
jgi:hypothetical protein